MKCEEVTLYYNWCGRKLVYRKKRINIYNRETGKPVYHYIYTCPMKWLLFWHDHTLFKRDEGKLQEIYID